MSDELKSFEDTLQERYGPQSTIGLITLIAIPFLIVISLGFVKLTSEVRPEDQVILLGAFLVPMTVLVLVPSFAIYLLLDHLWERKIKRVKDRKFRERYP